MDSAASDFEHEPFDRRLVEQVRPPAWTNPRPSGRYDLVVIGAGTAGLVAAAGAAGLGAKVALIEKHRLGGDCLNSGCVPSKALLASARVAAAVDNADQYGIRVSAPAEIDFDAVMSRMRRLRAELARHDSAERFRTLGVDVFFGDARFGDAGRTIRIGTSQVQFKRAVVCTGSRPAVPPIPGLSAAGFLTNETVFSLTDRPKRLAVIGGGPIGCELGQAFARLGTEVTLIERGDQVLPKDDPDAASLVEQSLVGDGVRLFLRSEVKEVVSLPDHKRLVVVRSGEAAVDLPFDQVLVAVGRRPNTEDLGLEAAGIEYDAHTGIKVDDYLRTTNRWVYAAGDVCTPYRFTHAADAMARLVVRNALFPGRRRASRLLIPWCTYTSPEVAHVGMTATDAAERNIPIDTFTQDLASVDRALLDSETTGFVRVHLKRGTDRILGATLVAAHAGELISQLTFAMRNGIGLRKIAETVFPYPTQAEAIRKLADAYNRTRLTPRTRKLLALWFR